MGDSNTNSEKWYCGYNGVTYNSRSEGLRALRAIRDSLYDDIAEKQIEMDSYKADWNTIDTFEQSLVNYYSLFSEQRELVKDMANFGDAILLMLNDNPHIYVKGQGVSPNIEDISHFVRTMDNFYNNITDKMKEYDECGRQCDGVKKLIAEEIEKINNAIEVIKEEIDTINYYI